MIYVIFLKKKEIKVDENIFSLDNIMSIFFYRLLPFFRQLYRVQKCFHLFRQKNDSTSSVSRDLASQFQLLAVVSKLIHHINFLRNTTRTFLSNFPNSKSTSRQTIVNECVFFFSKQVLNNQLPACTMNLAAAK